MNINSSSPQDASNTAMNRDIMFSRDMLQKLQPTLAAGVKQMIKKFSNKSYDLYLVHIWLLKKCTDQFILLMMAVINNSIIELGMHHCPKHATIMPLLRKPELEKQDKYIHMKSSFISILIKKVVVKEHLQNTKLLLLVCLLKRSFNRNCPVAYSK